MPELRVIRSWQTASAETVHVTLRVGEFRGPFAIGSNARAYFDGATLFAASVDPGRPAVANQVPLPLDWKPLPCPSVIDLGTTQLAYEATRDSRVEARSAPKSHDGGTLTRVWSRGTIANFLQPQGEGAAPPAGSLQSGQTTIIVRSPAPPPPALPRVMPTTTVAMAPEARHASPSSKPAFIEAVTVVRPPLSASVFRDGPPAAGQPPTLPETGLATTGNGDIARLSILRRLGERFRDDLRRTPRVVRLALLVLPILGWAALTFARSSDQDSEAPDRPVPIASAAVSSAAPSAAVVAQPVVSSTGGGSATASPSAGVAPTEIAPGSPPALGAASAATSAEAQRAGGRVGRDDSEPGGRTLEARAADAAARGAYIAGAALYDRLRELHPDRPEFASAARILRAKPAESAR